MKIFIGGWNACSVHSEKDTIERIILEKEFEFVSKPYDADINIILDTCIGTYKSFLTNFRYLKELLEIKKSDARVIVSGCLSKGVKFDLSDEEKKILEQVEIVKPEDIIEYVKKICNSDNKIPRIPFYQDEEFLRFSPVTGCINNCSFCKVAYQNFDLQSYSIEDINILKKHIIENEINYVSIFSSNLSLYGLDLYKKQKAHEIIQMISKIESVKYISCGCLINFYPELIEEIIKNPKIKVIHVSLETGSYRLYSLMNRPISLEKWISIIETIRENRPDITISTEIIAGYPTEKIEDIEMTLDLVKRLNLHISNIFPYMNSPQIPASKLLQHSEEYKRASEKRYKKELEVTNNIIEEEIKNGECYILDYDDIYNEYYLLYPDGSKRIISSKDIDGKYKKNDFINKTKKLIY